jgi:demethylmenaquinone methyltransferase/2-methoxy-6-polyprenyl-1,4-benzoquinol methylase
VQRFTHIDVSQARDDVLIEKGRLDRALATGKRLNKISGGELIGIGLGTKLGNVSRLIDGIRCDQIHETKPTRVIIPDSDAALDLKHDMIMLWIGRRCPNEIAWLGRAVLGFDREPAGHAEMHDEGFATRQRNEKTLRPPANLLDALPLQSTDKIVGKRKAEIWTILPNLQQEAACKGWLKATADCFDFRQFRHRAHPLIKDQHTLSSGRAAPRPGMKHRGNVDTLNCDIFSPLQRVCRGKRLAYGPAMTDQSTQIPPESKVSFGFTDVEREEKAGLVRGVFNRSARRYDLMNDLMSLGVHRVWKDMVMTRANPQPGELLVDVAGGTGDLARSFLDKADRAGLRRAAATPARAIVLDINEQMLRAGVKRGVSESHNGRINWVTGNAECLPLKARSADCITISTGIRNVTDRARALADMRRVLKPGGRFLCLEFTRPTSRAWEKAYDAWSFNVMPELGALVAKDRESYQYLVESIRRFPNQDDFADELRTAGFRNVSYTNFSGGIAALHAGWA